MVSFYFHQDYGLCVDNFLLSSDEAYMIVNADNDIIIASILSNTSQPYINSNINDTVQIYYTSDVNKFSEYYYFQDDECFQNTLDRLENDGFDIVTFIGELEYPNGRIDINAEQEHSSFFALNYGNKTVSSLYIHNKEVQSIKLASNNTVIYSKGAVVEEPNESITPPYTS